jgi:hypothetical protein
MWGEMKRVSRADEDMCEGSVELQSQSIVTKVENSEIRATNFEHTTYVEGSRVISGSIVSDYGLDDRGSIPGRGKGYFLYPLCPDRL